MLSFRLAVRWLNLWLLLSCSATNALAQVFDERFDDWPVDLKIDGTIVATDSMAGLPAIADFLANGIGNRGSTDSQGAITLVSPLEPSEDLIEQFASRGMVLSRQVNFAATVLDADSASPDEGRSQVVVWIDDRVPEAIPVGEREQLEGRFRQHLARDGTLVVIGPVVELLSKWWRPIPALALDDTTDQQPRASDAQPPWQAGFNLFPDCILCMNSGRAPSAIAGILPKCVGITAAPSSVLLLRGRKLQLLDGKGVICVGAESEKVNPHEIPLEQTILPPRSSRQRPTEWLIDLTQWRRRAIDLTLAPFPAADVEVPNLPTGTLLIVGGGGIPEGLMERFVELAGGVEQAKLVYVPCEEADEVAEPLSLAVEWQRMGVKSVNTLHTKDRIRADQDEAFFAPLRNATGIWFGGGRQWNLADSYYGTTTHRLMKEVLHRGGVIGGSSAGASIQARYLARATPIENFDIMAPGYERGGLGFIGGVAIDQHFSQRQRQPDMTELVKRYPQLLGIGIDETTAIIVQQSMAQVVGEGKVYFYDASQPAVAGQPDYEALPAGETYDLANRRQAPAN